MAKIRLGTRPKNFKHRVTVKLHEGATGTVEMSYIYRTRTEFGAFIDEMFKDAGVAPKSQTDEDVKFSLGEALEKTRNTNAEYILKIADGWDLDEPFDLASVRQFCDELPGGAFDVIEGYRLAVSEGRLGN